VVSQPSELSIQGDGDGVIATLVNALDDLPAAMPDYVLVGGLAVIVRVAGAHRVTRDVDAVTWSPDGTNDAAIAVLIDAGAERTANGARFEGVEIDVIATGDFAEDDVAALDEYDRAFITSHRWAFDSAEPVQIVVFTRDGVQASTAVSLATPSALVAMKLGAIPRRKLANPAKRASDLYDIYRLIQVFNRRGDLATNLGRAPHELGPWCRDQLLGLLVDQAERSSLWLATEGSPAMQAVSAEDLRAVGEVVVEDMNRPMDDADA
jgi:hypothetical protein